MSKKIEFGRAVRECGTALREAVEAYPELKNWRAGTSSMEAARKGAPK